MRPRFFYHNDASFLLYCAPPLTEDEFVYEAVGRYLHTQVDALVHHMYAFGDATPLWPTEVPEGKPLDNKQVGFVSEWRQQEIMRRLWKQGIDPWEKVVKTTKDAGLEYWVAARFNDGHSDRYLWKSEFTVNHPEYELGDKSASPHYSQTSMSGGGNFAIPEVRAHRLALAEEVCTKYDADGFEWDFTRHPGHHCPDMEDARDILTAYMREARAMLNRIGDARGRPMGFGLRIPGTIEKCHGIGLEIETWIGEGLVDFVSPTPYWDTVTELPFEEFIDLAKGTDCRVLGCTSEQVGPNIHPVPPRGALRAGALNAWQQGVDGIYLFNFHHQTIHQVDDTQLLSELGDPWTLAFRDKLYVVSGTHENVKVYPPRPFHTGNDYQLPRALTEGATETIRFRVADDLARGAERGVLEKVELRINLVSMTSEDAFEFRLNGKPLPADPVLDMQWNYNLGPLHNAYQGHYILVYDLTPATRASAGEWVRQGVNEMQAILKKRNPAIRTEFVLHDIELEINYRITTIRA